MIGQSVTRILGAFLALTVALTLGPQQAASQGISLALGTQAPSAAMEDLDGNPVNILDYVEEGKPTLIEFWASWCEQCEALQPQLDKIQQEWGEQVNVVAVAVAVSQSQRRVRRHVEDHGVEYPYLWDAEGNGVKGYEIPGTGIVVILDGEGAVAYTGAGGDQDLVGVMSGILGLKKKS